MRLFSRLMFVVVLVSLAVVSSASHVAAQRQVTTTITRLYTGADGQSHAEDTEVAWRPAQLRTLSRVGRPEKVYGNAGSGAGTPGPSGVRAVLSNIATMV